MSAAGLDALDAALSALYPGVEPGGWESLLRQESGNPDPLDAVRCYRCQDHWHYVTLGLTELYRKVSSLPEQSGFGFELTFRLEGANATAPDWPVAFLQGLAGYVAASRRTFAPGDLIDLGGPLGGQDTALVAALFVCDPALPVLETPHGAVRFVQVVGLTRAEFEAARDGGVALEPGLRERSALLVTSLARARSESDGERRPVSCVEWESPDDEQVLLTLDAEGRRLLRSSLDAVAHGATLELDGPDQSVRFVAGAADWSRSRSTLIVRVPPEATATAAMESWMREWTLPALPFLRIRVRE